MLKIAEHRYPAALRQPRHAHADTTVTIVLGGGLIEQVGRDMHFAQPLSIVVKPRDTEHANEFGNRGTHTLQIRVPTASVTQLVQSQRMLGHWQWRDAGPSVPAFLALLKAIRTCRRDGCECRQFYAADALAALAVENLPARAAPPQWLRCVREAIDDGMSPPRLADLAGIAGVHPVYLARKFRQYFGCSISQYIRRRRVQKVADLIGSQGPTLSTIAQSAGFTDQAHMCRVFKAETALTPNQFRGLIL